MATRIENLVSEILEAGGTVRLSQADLQRATGTTLAMETTKGELVLHVERGN